MIDTVRFSPPIDDETKNIIKKCSSQKRDEKPIHEWDTESNAEEVVDGRDRFYYARPLLFDTHYRVYVSIYLDNLYIEFSAPKVMYGSNIYMHYPDKLLECLNRVKALIDDYYKIKLPDPIEWVLQRLDICYAWRLPSNEEAKKVLIALSSYDFPRKKKVIIANETVSYYGTDCKIKFYLKQPEYKAHSMGRPKRGTYDYTNAQKMYEACAGILRFEITLKKKQVQRVFGENETNYTRITYPFLELLLKDYLSQLVRSYNFKSTDLSDIYQTLEDKYGKKQALNLFQFLNTWFCEDKTREKLNRLLLDSKMCTSTIKKRLDLLNNADVGIITTGKEVNFDLSIPSTLAVNAPSDNVMELLPKLEHPILKLEVVKE